MKKIHKALTFTLQAFLKECIQFNNNKGKESDNVFERAFFAKTEKPSKKN